ncbi:hypothetical protein MPTK2_4g05480 [Marchantia polymorpha subsp. ruderalis]
MSGRIWMFWEAASSSCGMLTLHIRTLKLQQCQTSAFVEQWKFLVPAAERRSLDFSVCLHYRLVQLFLRTDALASNTSPQCGAKGR